MNKTSPALILAAFDVLILALYPLPPAAGDIPSALLGATLVFVAFGLLCVFGSEKLEAFRGPVMRGGYVNQNTPAGMFVVFGFLLLSLPIVIVVYRFLSGSFPAR
jgi:hypothetical protein